MSDYRYTTYQRRPDLLTKARRLNGSVWPEYLFHDAVVDHEAGRVPAALCAIQTAVVGRCRDTA